MNEYLYEKIKALFEIVNQKPLTKEEFLSEIKIDETKRIVWLENEMDIFNRLFRLRKSKVLYHYTSFDSLLYIIRSGQLKFSGVTGFNDANELRSKSTILGDGVKHPFNESRINRINNKYAFCLSKRKDNLTQWRLYGDDGKGICFGFNLNTNKISSNGMYAGEVNYGEDIKTHLNSLGDSLKKKWGYTFEFCQSSKWGYFIKGDEWKDEKEVRLLLIAKKNNRKYNLDSWSTNSHGILYPSMFVDLDKTGLDLSSITLGPKSPVPKLNKVQISILLKTCYEKWKSKPIRLSKITSYR